tara:strand:+ start:6824 stop:10420 length:3597 start_codon:yes stop_codon:yes gene_type:complete
MKDMYNGESKVSAAFQENSRSTASEGSSWADIMAERESQGAAVSKQAPREEQDDEAGFLAKTAEMIPSVGHGILKSVQETGNLALEASNGINKFLSQNGAEFLAGTTDRKMMDWADDPSLVHQPEYTAGKLTSAVANFMAPMGALNKATKGVKTVSKLAKFAKAGSIGAAIDFAAFDPEEKRLSNLLRENFQFRDPITAYLASNPKDSRAEGRLKNTLEGLGIGIAAEGLTSMVRAYRANRIANNVISDGAEVTQKAGQIDLPLEGGGTPKLDADGKAIDEVIPAKTDGPPEIPEEAMTKIKGEVKANRPSQAPIEEQIDMGFGEVTLKEMSDEDLGRFIADLDEAPTKGKVGRFNLDIIQSSDDLKRLVGAMAKRSDDGIEVVTNEATLAVARKDMAKGLGLTEETLLALPEGSVLTSPQMVQAKAVLFASRDYLAELTEQVIKNPSEANKARLAMQMDKFGSIQRAWMDAGTETARALEIRKTTIDLKGVAEQNRYLDDVVNLAGGSDQIDDFLEAVQKMSPKERGAALSKASRGMTDGKTMGEIGREIWIHGLLSGPTTQVGNFVTNTLNYTLAPLERGLAEASSRLGGNTASSISKGETAVMLTQMTDIGTYMDAFRMFNKARKSGKSGFGGGTKIDIETALSSEARGWDPNGVAGKSIDFLSPYIRWGNRYLTAADDFAKHLNYQQEVSALAHRKGMRAQIANGMDDAALRDFIDDAMRNPDKSIKHGAFKKTQENTLTKDLGDINLPGFKSGETKMTSGGTKITSQSGLESLEETIKKIPVLRNIAPFTKISMNMTEFAVNRTPFAKGLKADIAAGGIKRDAALGRIGVGMSAMGIASYLTTQGNLTGSGPSNMNARKTLEASGWQADSIQMGNYSVKLDTLGPMGAILKLAATSTEIAGAIDRDQIDGAQDAIMQVGFAMAEFATPEFITESFSEFLEALNGDEKAVESFVSGVVGSLTPMSSAVRFAAKKTDGVKRDSMGDPNSAIPMIDKILNNLKKGIPGLSSDLPAVRNIFGEVQENHYSLTGAHPDDVVLGDNKGDAISDFMKETNMTGPGNIDNDEALDYLKITKPSKTISFSSGGISAPQKLSPKQYERYSQLAGGHDLETNAFGGATLRESLNDEINSDFPMLGNGERTTMAKILVINKIVSEYKKAAKAQLMAEDLDLSDSIQEGFMEKAQKTMGGSVDLNL